jgi:hypothetical protein
MRPSPLCAELAALETMKVAELHVRYAAIFGEQPRTRHRQYLVRRIAWRMQADAEGGLSERAIRRAERLAADADVRVTAPRVGTAAHRPTPLPPSDLVALPPEFDPRLPKPGTVLVRNYKGHQIRVHVTDVGFEHDGKRYESLSALASEITGSHINGFRFFGLNKKKAAAAPASGSDTR